MRKALLLICLVLAFAQDAFAVTNLRGSHFRFGINELLESTHGWYANEDVNPTHTWGFTSFFLLRFVEQEVGATAAANTDATFQYRKNGGAWTDITTTSSNVKAVNGVLVNAAACTKRLSGTGTFETSGAGQTEDGTSGGSANDIAASGNSETEIALQFVEADLAHGDVIDFQFISPDWVVTMDVSPSITIVKATDGTVNLTGIAATASAGTLSVAVVVDGTANLTGIGATSGLGTLSVSAGTNETVSLTGISATAGQGSITMSGDATLALTGISATAGQGSLTLLASATVSLTGLPATAGGGTLSASDGSAPAGQQTLQGGGLGDQNTPMGGMW